MSKIRNSPGPEEKFFLLSDAFARDPRVTPRAARVYIYLRSHRTGWDTNVRRIGDVLGMGKDTVNNALNDLEFLGYVERAQVRGDSGKFDEIEYIVHPLPRPENADTVDDVHPEDDDRVPNNRTRKNQDRESRNRKNQDRGNRTHKGTIPKGTTDKGTIPKDPPIVPQGTSDEPADRFPEFYDQTYPRRVGGRIAAEKAWAKAIKNVDPQTVIDGAERYAAWCKATARETKFIAHPSTWLNQGRWDEELEWPTTNPAGSTLADWGAPSTQQPTSAWDVDDPFGNLRGPVIDHEEQP